jgi:translation elongation factor EF-G
MTTKESFNQEMSDPIKELMSQILELEEQKQFLEKNLNKKIANLEIDIPKHFRGYIPDLVKYTYRKPAKNLLDSITSKTVKSLINKKLELD